MTSHRLTTAAPFAGGDKISLNGDGMDLSLLAGGVAVVTGSGSVTGLGFGLAREAAKMGMHVCISDVRQEAIDEAVSLLRMNARFCFVLCVHVEPTSGAAQDSKRMLHCE